jgi:DNA-directed RNA polymerase specialized sigma24 family protein
MIECRVCDIFIQTHGAGKLECRKCDKYKSFQVKSAPRPPIIFEPLSELIKESCAEQPQTITIITHIQHLPRELSVPLMMHYALNMTHQEIADYHGKKNKSYASRKIKSSVEIIKEMLK